ncbi:MAG: phosphatase PAP2 family protein [Rickettsiales bacterium]|jgi:membrane-associated phospholipid phosphatase|nr:phosphatase PAP2 family protein [Rickettsiales bacterium]
MSGYCAIFKKYDDFVKKVFLIFLAAALFPLDSYSKSYIESIGDNMQVLIPAYALGLSMAEEDWNGAIQLAQTLIASQLTVESLKYIVREERPNKSNNRSFPSGHTAGAFSGATFIHKRYGIRRAIIPYAMAGFVGYSRVRSKMHYAHDVAAGAVISIAFTWLLVGEYDGKLSIESDGTGAKLNFRTQF